MSWVREATDQVLKIWDGDKKASEEQLEPFWKALTKQMDDDISEFRGILSQDARNPAGLIKATPHRLQFGYHHGASVEISMSIEDRCLYVIYLDSKYGQNQTIPITSAQGDFPKLSQSILMPVLFPRLLHERGRVASR